IVAVRYRVVLATIAVVVAVAAGWSALLTPQYVTSSTVALATPVDVEPRDPQHLQTMAVTLVRSCIAVTTEPVVLGPAAGQVGRDIVREQIVPTVKARALRDTTVLTVTVSDTSAVRAA